MSVPQVTGERQEEASGDGCHHVCRAPRGQPLLGPHPWSDWIIWEAWHENQFLEPDRDGGCNQRGVVGGHEHTNQRPGSTAARPEAKAEKGSAARAATTATTRTTTAGATGTAKPTEATGRTATEPGSTESTGRPTATAKPTEAAGPTEPAKSARATTTEP